jgi:AAA+ ATPase superfamily predicted ATPase
MADLIIGRNREIKILEDILSSNKAEFLTVHGRRRVGKTFLIKNFMKKEDVIFFRVTGMKDASFRKQIRHVTDEIGITFYRGVRLEAKKDWSETFALLTDAMRQVEEKNKPIFLFFDEFPWMATKKSLLLQTLDHYWNHVWSDDRRIKLIICGSASSWIINKIVNNKGGLHNRVTKNIRLEPFNLKETKDYLTHLNISLNNSHIIHIYMVTGGIPYYLSHIERGLSAAQIIGSLAFHRDSLLLNEFGNLYSSLFEDPEKYIDLMRIICKKWQGVSQSEIIKKSKYFSKGGRITKKLQELEQAGFIISFIPYQHKRQGIYYRLIDEYTLFYFYWIEAIRNKLKKGDLNSSYWETIQKLPAWKTWAEYAFEALCFKHLSHIRNALGISSDAMVDSWRYTPRKGTQEEGAQIDLLFDRNDDSITLCEIKYMNGQFIIDKHVLSSLDRKAAVFKERTRTKKQLFWAIIAANGLKKTPYSEKLAVSVVTVDELFKQVQ